MSSDINYVRQELEAARKKQGRIAEIMRGAKVDRRTLNAYLDESRSPREITTDRLVAYFKKEARKAEKEQA